VKFAVVHASRGDFPVATLCKVFGVSRSGYYDFVRRMKRPTTQRERAARKLDHEIRVAFDEGRGGYGRPRILRALRKKGMRIGENRIRRRMAAMRLQAKPRRRFVRTTLSDHDHRAAPNLVRQNFSAEAANRVWCSDITYVRTWEGWVYVTVIIDLFSRKVVGWATAEHMRAKLVTDAMTMAIGRRDVEPGLIFHSDRGSQYVSKAVRELLRRHEMQQSMSAKGNCYDNAVVESFNDKLKQELIHRDVWPTRARAQLAIADYIERFYNPKRMHSTLGYLSPNEYEEQHAA